MKSFRLCSLLVLLMSWAGAWGQGIMIPVSYYAVQGAPFTLTFEMSTNPSRPIDPKQFTQRILRDAAGRQRYEAPVVDGVPRSTTANIYDVVAGKMIKLDLKAKTAEVGEMHVGRTVLIDASVANSLAPLSAGADQTLLGTRQIAGLEAWGQRTVKNVTRMDGFLGGTQDRELWLSTHYRIPVMQIIKTDRSETTQTVVSFDGAEPDAGLFKIPAGFTVTDAPPPPQRAPGTVQMGPDVSAPKVVKTADPEFSEEARRKKISGNVLVHFVVDEQGLPQDVKVTRGIGSGLDEKAVEAVKQYRFNPAMRKGVPVKVEMNIEVNFQIFGKP